jgi:hypothetical protein
MENWEANRIGKKQVSRSVITADQPENWEANSLVTKKASRSNSCPT